MPRTVILNIASDTSKVSVVEEKVVIAEGRLVAMSDVLIDVEYEVKFFDDSDTVIVSFWGNGYYINVYDHRKKTVEGLMADETTFWSMFFSIEILPCLVTMRKKGRTLYMALADLGDSETDIVNNGDLELAIGGHYDRSRYRVVNNAIHPGTGICLVRKHE